MEEINPSVAFVPLPNWWRTAAPKERLAWQQRMERNGYRFQYETQSTMAGWVKAKSAAE
jgi:hypothetical protein